jgi:hypothetical protein
MTPFAKLAAYLGLITSLPFASATFSIARCCTLAVRTGEYKKYIESDGLLPWDVCNLNKEIDYAADNTFPSVMRTMSWVKQYCRGTQYSNTRQWLQPLATYISPYIGLLLLCPVGEEDPHESVQGNALGEIFLALRTALKEYISILGDPASAVFGAASEVYADTVALYSITSLPADRQRAIWVAALAGSLKFSSETGWRRGVVEGSKPTKSVSTGQKATTTPSPPNPEETTRAIIFCMAARTSFASAIFIPVVLTLALNAAAFYDAYAKKGDKDTSLALAYCVWYSWILVPAVAGNCFATVLSPDVARRAFGKVMDFGKGQRVAVALRDRHVNNQFWANWVQQQEGDGKDFVEFAEQLGADVWFWARFCGWKLMGWCCIAIACGAAAAIAWMTPTVGLGCRSFNFILYGLMALGNGFLHIVYSWLTVRGRFQREIGERPILCGLVPTLTIRVVVRWVYWSLVVANSLVMVLGTVFHLVGVFRNCWCDRLTWNDDTLIELNSKTAEAVANANSYWISTAYVVFSIMTLVCISAVVFRQIICRRMDEWMDMGTGGDDDA